MSQELHGATLIVLLYCQKEHAGRLKDVLHTSGLMKINKATDIEPPQPKGEDDTTVFLLALEGAAEVAQSWRLDRRRVQKALSNKLLEETIIGYTLIYQAISDNPLTLEDEPLATAVSEARRLGSGPSAPMANVLHEKVTGGTLWLVDTPVLEQDGGWNAGMVYVAISPSEEANDDLNEDVVMGALRSPDLIAHKGYYHIRQYQGNGRVGHYKELTERIYKKTMEHFAKEPWCLTEIKPRRQDEEGVRELREAYPQLVQVAPTLEYLYTMLMQQIEKQKNYQPQDAGVGRLMQHHWDNLYIKERELSILVRQGQIIMQAAQRAIELERARDEQAILENEQRITTLLAIVGAVVAVPELLPAETICQVWDSLSLWRNLPCGEGGAIGALFPVSIQIALIAVLSKIAWRWFGKKR